MRDLNRVLTFTPGEVAKLFGVEAKTVARWANEGKLPSFRTPGGHRRFRREHVMAMLETYQRGA